MAAPSAGPSPTAGFDLAGLRQLLSDLKEIDPKLATSLRRELRRSGDAAIAEMSRILDAYAGGTVTGKTFGEGVDRAGNRRRRMITGLTVTGAARARSRGSREEVKRGLRTRVVAGRRTTAIRLATTTGALRMALNTRNSWRHPVFANAEASWVEQPGARYFSEGAYSQRDATRQAVYEALDEALKTLEGRTYHLTVSDV